MPSEFVFIPNPLFEVEVARSPEVKAGVVIAAEDVAMKAQELAPVDTGRLRDSVQVVATSEALGVAAADVVANVPYAGFVEFGTSRQAAEPYLRPALDAVVGR